MFASSVPGSRYRPGVSSRKYYLALLPLLAACAVATHASSAAAEPASSKPASRARAFLQHQLDVAKDRDALTATFAAHSVILHHGVSTDARRASMLGIGDGGADGASTASARISNLLAGGNSEVVWLYAEVSTQDAGRGSRPGLKGTTRVVELIASSADWRAVAASFGDGEKLQGAADNIEIENATDGDHSLAKLLSSPDALVVALAPDAIVVGPESAQVAQGKDAKAALAKWALAPIVVYRRPRELHDSDWAFAQANYDQLAVPADKLRGIAQVFALPKPDGTWVVVLAQYRAN